MNRYVIIALTVLGIILVGVVAFFVMIYPTMVTPKPVTQTPIVMPAAPQQPVVQQAAPLTAQIKLLISSPLDKAVVTSPNLTIIGETVPNANVTVNETDLRATATGKFTTRLTLAEGDNPINIIAVDENGNYSEKEITVTYQTTQ